MVREAARDMVLLCCLIAIDRIGIMKRGEAEVDGVVVFVLRRQKER